MQAGEDFVLIDTRNPHAWAESGEKAAGAIRFPLDEVDNTSRAFPRASPSSPTALDPTKDPAPVWRRHFRNAGTTPMHSKEDSTPGAKPASRSNQNSRPREFRVAMEI